MKPTLLLSAGWAYAATSPLAYTLQRLTKYAHGGYSKNIHYFKCLAKNPLTPDPELRELYKRVLFNTWEGYDTNTGHKLNRPEDLEPLSGFSKKTFSNMVTLPYTLDKYIDYYKALYEQVQPYGYKAVADYQVNYAVVQQFIPQLQQHFDLKILLIARDPIRRAVSKAKWHHTKSPEQNTIHNGRFTNLLEPFFKDYVTIFNTIREMVPNTHMIIMEDLWEDDGTEKKKLEVFLDHNIPELWPNLYCPDIGHLLTWDLQNTYCPTPCQVNGQSCFELTVPYYNELREQFKYYYDSWIQEYGSLPRGWGEPIDYSANLQRSDAHTESRYK